MDDINKPSSSDYGYAVAKAGLGSIPIIGAAASELLGLILTPPLEKRRQKWMSEIGHKLKELEEKDKIDLSSLKDNEQFIDVVLVATNLAIKTSQEGKLKAFQNAVINSALRESPNETKAQLFLNFLDTFTIWHINFLHFIDNPIKWFENAGQKAPNLYMGSLFRILQTAYPDLHGQDELADVIWRDLHDNGLHRTTDLKTTMLGDDLLANRTSELGKEFIHFISPPQY